MKLVRTSVCFLTNFLVFKLPGDACAPWFLPLSKDLVSSVSGAPPLLLLTF